MATRMQQRRGTAAQWISTNNGNGPTLNAGEIGFETDTGKFKIGDGTSPWTSLSYFADVATLGTALDGDFVEVTDIGAANGVAGLDSNKNLLVTGASIIVEGATPDSYEMTITATDPTADRTITLPDATGTVALTSDIPSLTGYVTETGTQTLTNKTLSLSSNTISGSTADFNTALTDSNFVTTGDTGTVTSTMIANGTIVNDDINATAAIALTKLATDPLARANHTGTQTASTISDFDTQVRTSRLDQMAAPTASVSMNSQKITSLAAPEASTDAATKAYVDAVSEGLHIHPSCDAATSANVDISTELEAGDVVDGVTLVAGNRVLVKSQTNAAQNGIYVVQASGAALRASDFNEPLEVDGGDFVFVTGGTLYDNTGWVQTTTNVVTIGTDPIVFTQFSGAGTYQAGTGLTLTGNVFSINTSTTVDTSTAQTLTNKTLTSPVINTPSGITKSDVGLGNVDNTSDANKPISTATQTALDLKANLASPTFTGTVVLPNSTVTNAMLANSSVTINGTAVSLGGSTTISAAPTPQAVSSNITLQHNYNYFVDTTAARSLTLPASPSLGDTIAIFDASSSAATNNITVLSNSSKINGTVQDLAIDVNNAAVVLIYTGATYGWRVG
jgi:hypothetical protein